MPDLVLTPFPATLLFVVMVISGRQFRVNWKGQEPGWEVRAWLYGVPAALSFATLAFVPLEFS